MTRVTSHPLITQFFLQQDCTSNHSKSAVVKVRTDLHPVFVHAGVLLRCLDAGPDQGGPVTQLGSAAIIARRPGVVSHGSLQLARQDGGLV